MTGVLHREHLKELGPLVPPTAEENEMLTRVGRDTPMGTLIRRYWIPACLASEVPDPDCSPVRVRLLGENLVAFRDSEGKVGVVDAFCAHRRAPLYFGRNEECGLRCIYHGWKFNTVGECVDLPSEPDFSRMKQHVKLKAYPTHEAGGLVWAYMGPEELQPPLPDYEWLRVPDTHFKISKVVQLSNYLQGIEGGIDTVHSSFLHNEDIQNKEKFLRNRDRHPELEVEFTDYGFKYVGIRKVSEDENYIRGYQFIMPIQKLQGNFSNFAGREFAVPVIYGHLWVPIDDENVMVYSFRYSRDKDDELTEDVWEEFESRSGRGKADFISGTFHLKKNMENEYLRDRERQRTQSFTGIIGINTQDLAVQEGMGSIVERSEEFLGTSDKAIVACRQILLEALDDLANGRDLLGLDPKPSSAVRGADVVVSSALSWQDAMKEAFTANW
jgi:phenylpropionate dioxygenase-like ring-hydroxylating dioxygenase large terminal subunit